MKSNSLREAEMWKEHVQKRSCKTFPKAVCLGIDVIDVKTIFWKWLSITIVVYVSGVLHGEAERRGGQTRCASA